MKILHVQMDCEMDCISRLVKDWGIHYVSGGDRAGRWGSWYSPATSQHVHSGSHVPVTEVPYPNVSEMEELLFVKDITQWWTLVELCHEIITVTATHVVRLCSTDHFS